MDVSKEAKQRGWKAESLRALLARAYEEGWEYRDTASSRLGIIQPDNPYVVEKRVLITEPYDGHPDTETCPGCPHKEA